MPDTPYMTPTDLRVRVPALANVDNFPDIVLSELVTEFEQIAEHYRGVAFTPRTAIETIVWSINSFSVWPRNRGVITTFHYPIRSVTSITLDAVLQAATTYTVSSQLGQIEFYSGDTPGTVVVTYLHGLDSPPQPILRACREYVRACAMSDTSGTSRDILSQTFDGGVTRYSTPSYEQGRPTGFLEVDRLLNSVRDYRLPGVA